MGRKEDSKLQLCSLKVPRYFDLGFLFLFFYFIKAAWPRGLCLNYIVVFPVPLCVRSPLNASFPV